MKFNLIIATLLAFARPALAQDEVPTIYTISPDLQANVQFLNPDYLVYKPVDAHDTKLPLLIFLHGAGGVGSDLEKVKSQPTIIWKGIHEYGVGPCIVVAPQCIKTTTGERGIWTPEDLNLLLKDIQSKLPINEHRIYLSGNSMGGYGTWAWGAHDPQLFAAIAPIVGGIGREGPTAVTPDFDHWATQLAKVPVYAFVGALDKTVPPERSERMIAAIQKAGGKEAKFKIYPDEGHTASQVVLASAEYYEWLFSHKGFGRN